MKIEWQLLLILLLLFSAIFLYFYWNLDFKSIVFMYLFYLAVKIEGLNNGK